MSFFIKRIDPEKPYRIDHIWRPIYCLAHMPRVDWGWGSHTDQQRADAGYCLDRHIFGD